MFIQVIPEKNVQHCFTVKKNLKYLVVRWFIFYLDLTQSAGGIFIGILLFVFNTIIWWPFTVEIEIKTFRKITKTFNFVYSFIETRSIKLMFWIWAHQLGVLEHVSTGYLSRTEEKYLELRVSTIILIASWNSLIFYQLFLSPQVKRCAIISYKQGINELPHKLPNDLRLKILDN